MEKKINALLVLQIIIVVLFTYSLVNPYVAGRAKLSALQTRADMEIEADAFAESDNSEICAQLRAYFNSFNYSFDGRWKSLEERQNKQAIIASLAQDQGCGIWPTTAQ